VCFRYTTFYLTRGSLTYSAPSMVADPQLGFTLAHIGTMTSIFPMAYGVSKFAAGEGSCAKRTQPQDSMSQSHGFKGSCLYTCNTCSDASRGGGRESL
jgi:sugar phosphate permease